MFVAIIAVLLLNAVLLILSSVSLYVAGIHTFTLKRQCDQGDKNSLILYPLHTQVTQLIILVWFFQGLLLAGMVVLLDTFMPVWIAIMISGLVELVSGHIIPRLYVRNRSEQLSVWLSPVLLGVIRVANPVTRPLARKLDHARVRDTVSFTSKEELQKMLEIHEISEFSDIKSEELWIIKQALSFGTKIVEDAMVPKKSVIGVEASQIISPVLLDELYKSNHSRFPVYEKDLNHIVGTLYMKDLVKMKDGRRAREVMNEEVYYVNARAPLDHAIDAFLKTKQHLFIVVDELEEVAGIVTIEDILEQILGRKVVDEFDMYDDVRAVSSYRPKLKEVKETTVVEEESSTKL